MLVVRKSGAPAHQTSVRPNNYRLSVGRFRASQNLPLNPSNENSPLARASCWRRAIPADGSENTGGCAVFGGAHGLGDGALWSDRARSTPKVRALAPIYVDCLRARCRSALCPLLCPCSIAFGITR